MTLRTEALLETPWPVICRVDRILGRLRWLAETATTRAAINPAEFVIEKITAEESLAPLPIKQRRILMLGYGEGYTQLEIALLLGSSVRTIVYHHAAALKRLARVEMARAERAA
jgi:DNA-directed RNA polymerase specialized sigma24 family protein